MAEIILTFALEETLKKVGSLAVEGIRLPWGFKGQFQKLKQSLDTIRAVLYDAEERQAREASVAYEAEDMLDEFGYEVLLQKVETTPTEKVRYFFSASSNPFAFRLGMDSDVSEVINLLNVLIDDQVLSNVPIVGMGGLGKTTLAKLVVKEIEDRNLFNKIIWVCVSQSFNKQSILGAMLQDFSGANIGGLSSLNIIVRQLKERLQGKRFLLVLDDVWNDEIEKWETLKEDLSIVRGNNGKCCNIVTTRKHQTASVMETSSGCRHELKGLRDEEYCWSIIQKMVDSGNDKASISGKLEGIGKDIAKKCGGVPLAARMLGRVDEKRQRRKTLVVN
ncbi:hypothetical protein Tsubulata_016074, partial [Turnera subulata]